MFREKLQRFMLGRYGNDYLNRFLLIAALVLVIISMFARSGWLTLFVWALLLVAWFRMLSRNTVRRQHENMVYWRYRERVRKFLVYQRSRWRDRKTHRYFDCPQCRAHLRVPKGKGRVSIRCNKCGHEFERTT